MALINCKECKKEISEDAKTCPHCGADINTNLGCGTLIVIVFAALILFNIFSSNSSNSSKGSASIDMRQSASGACMQFIKQVLNDPDSAEFSNSSESVVSETAPNQWTVQREVRAKNAFNAIRLSNFECKMTFDGTTWRASSVNEIK